MLVPPKHLRDLRNRFDLHRGAGTAAVERMVVGIDRHRQCIRRARDGMRRLQHLARIQRMAVGIVIAQARRRFLQDRRRAVIKRSLRRGWKMREPRIETALCLAKLLQKFLARGIVIGHRQCVRKPNFRARPATVERTNAPLVHGPALWIRPRTVSMTMIRIASANEMSRPSQMKMRVPSAVVPITFSRWKGGQRLNAPKMTKKITNWKKAKKRFFIHFPLDHGVRRKRITAGGRSTAAFLPES